MGARPVAVAGRPGYDPPVLGAGLLVVWILVVLPVAFLASGAAASFLLGWALRDRAEATHEGSELIDLNR